MKRVSLSKGERRQRELKLASLRVDIMHLTDKKDACVKAEKYSEAEVRVWRCDFAHTPIFKKSFLI